MKKLLLISIISCLGFLACQKQAQTNPPEPKQVEPKQEEMSEEELGQKIEQAVKNKDWEELDRLLTEYDPGPVTISYDKEEIFEDDELYRGEDLK